MNKKNLFFLFYFLLILLIINCTEEEVIPLSPLAQSADGTAYSTVLRGKYTENVEIPPNNRVGLFGLVRFSEGTTLTIGAGSIIEGDTRLLSYLIIDRGAQIMANGTSANPITFTSSRAVGERSEQDWGGIVINGNATINNGTGDPQQATGEGDSGFYGGNSASDNSGSLRYVRIQFAGRVFTSENELNGLALQGVGSGTTIEFIHLHSCADDGIEMFGGTVNLANIISTGNGDDQIDWTGGWTGSISDAIVAPIGGDTGIEADNNSSDNTATPRSDVSITEIAYFGGTGEVDKRGLFFRAGAIARVNHAYIIGTADNKAITVGNGDNVDSESTIYLTNILIENSGAIGYQSKNVADEATQLVKDDSDSIIVNNSATRDTSAFNSLSDLSAAINSSANPSEVFSIPTDAATAGVVIDTAWINDWTTFPAN